MASDVRFQTSLDMKQSPSTNFSLAGFYGSLCFPPNIPARGYGCCFVGQGGWLQSHYFSLIGVPCSQHSLLEPFLPRVGAGEGPALCPSRNFPCNIITASPYSRQMAGACACAVPGAAPASASSCPPFLAKFDRKVLRKSQVN